MTLISPQILAQDIRSRLQTFIDCRCHCLPISQLIRMNSEYLVHIHTCSVVHTLILHSHIGSNLRLSCTNSIAHCTHIEAQKKRNETKKTIHSGKQSKQQASCCTICVLRQKTMFKSSFVIPTSILHQVKIKLELTVVLLPFLLRTA